MDGLFAYIVQSSISWRRTQCTHSSSSGIFLTRALSIFSGSYFCFDFCRNLISIAVSVFILLLFCDIYVFAFVYLLWVEVSEYAYDDHILDDAKATEKDTALRVALSELSGEFGKESMLSLQRFFGARRAPVISTGSLRLDQALGVGGLPKVCFL